ncbi:MAG: hypothetical protein IKE73_00385 [Bacilli bacterium]|nr:hypothetical protein [Bacilli bacterium]
MVNYADNKIYLEREELNYLKEIGDNNEAFKRENLENVNVSINFIDYFYSKIPLSKIKDIESYNFIEHQTLKDSYFDLCSKLRSIEKELINKNISKDQIAYLKYLSSNIKKYLSKKRDYDEYSEIFFPNSLKLNIKLKEN